MRCQENGSYDHIDILVDQMVHIKARYVRRARRDQGLETLQQQLLSAAAAIVGDNVLAGALGHRRLLTDWRHRYQGSALEVESLTSAEHVPQLVRLS